MPGFYSDAPQDCLLLGDIVTGFRAVVPQLHNPGADARSSELGISVTQPEYFAVTTPCCSVGDKQISLAPLISIRAKWLSNPFLAEDLTRINTTAPGENFVPPQDRGRLSPERLQYLTEQGPIYGFVECFVYAPHDLLQVYDLKGTVGAPAKCGYWLLEFGSAFRINCDKVTRKSAPAGVKRLELSVETRQILRAKIGSYYSRIPDEDRVAVGGGAGG